MAVIGFRGKSLTTTLRSLNRYSKAALAGVMSLSLVLQPIVAQAQSVTADPNAGANRPGISTAPNGVPSVNIVAPNDKGLSHNKYNDFNVGNSGLILNNHAGEVGTSQLGGVMEGNANLRHSGSASVILNEVTSGKRSSLEGPTEVFGRKADVIIANPNGITCNGCGFINTPRATLTTGVPQIGLDGTLSGFDVRGGDVTFGPKGANLASGKGSVDIFDVVSRTVKFDGPVAGHDIGITAGTGKYAYATREMKELYDIAGKPEYAIDGSALGALQGDRIKVIATEKGVGVRMRNDMAANAGQLTLSADGKISLNNVSGRDGVKITSRSKTIATKKITSKKNVEIKANDGITIETIGADGDLMVDSGTGLLSIEGDAIAGGKLGFKSGDAIKAAQVAAGSDMDIAAKNGIDVLVAISEGQARLHAENGNIDAKNGIKASGGDLVITADKGSINAATLISFNNMTLTAGQDLNIVGNVLAQANIKGNIGGHATALNYIAGMDMAATDKTGTITLGNQGGLTLKTGTGTIKANNVYANNGVNLDSGNGIDIAGTILSKADVDITAKRGQSQNVNIGRLMADGSANVRSSHLTIGSLLSGGDVALDIDTLDAGLVLSGMDMEASQKSPTGDIFLKNDGKLTINATNAIKADQLLSAGNMVLHAANDVTYGNLTSYGNADITSDKGTISIQNATLAAGDITLTALVLDLSNNRAKIQTARTLTLNANDINVSNSKLTYGGIILNSENNLNAQNTTLVALAKNGGSGNITLNLPSLVADENSNIQAENNLTINSVNVDNNGILASGNDLRLNVSSNLTNRGKGLIYSGRDGYIYVDGAVTNDYGAIMSDNDLTFANRSGKGRTGSIVNKAGLIQSGNDLSILTAYLRNEANTDPTWATNKEYGEKIKFARPDKNNELDNGLAGMRGRLFFNDKENPGWGAGACRKKNGDSCEVTWLHIGYWTSKEQTYGDLQVDGKTYKAFTWNEAGRNSKKGKYWYDFNYNAYMQQQDDVQYFTNKPTVLGMIQSKGNMNIDATTIDNLYSNIEAAGKANITADTVNNKGITLYRTKYMYCGAGDNCYAYDADGNKTGDFISNGGSGFLGKEAVDSANSVIKAGGELTMNVKTLNNTATEGSIAGQAHFEAKPSTGNPMDALNGMTAGGALFNPKVDVNAPNFTVENLPTPKPNSGGFGGTLPNQNFIYETRNDFLDISKFYGSSYFLSKIGYKPDRQILFLGDAYFENQLIDKQMRDLVGQGLGKGSFVAGNDPIEQMKALLDAGADYSAENGIPFGQPLTADQVANLDKSVVVYVKQSVNGVDVYAPVLYVSAKDRSSVVASGAKIEGGSVNITADNLTHSGLIVSNTSLKLEGTDILSNGGGFAAKGDLLLASTGNIQLNAATSTRNGQTVLNQTQAIDAGGTAIIQADKNVDLNGVDVKAGGSVGLSGENVNIGSAKASSNGSENTRGSNIEAGKDLQVKANQDINIEGSRVHADNQLAMRAENGDLTIQSAKGTAKNSISTTTLQQGSEVSSGGSMSLSADKNVTIAGSDVASGDSLGIKAGENVSIVATQEKNVTQDGTLAFDSTTNVKSSVSAKNDMGIEAGKDVLIGASDLKADGNIGIQAQGDISVVAMADSANSKLSGKIIQGERHSTTAVGSSITAGGNITAMAGQDGEKHNLNIIGSDIDAGGKVGLKTTGDINVLASQDTYQSQFHSKEGGGTFGKKHESNKSSSSSSLNGSSIHGDGGVDMQSGGDTTVFASDITAGSKDPDAAKTGNDGADINIQAGGNIIVASGNEFESSSKYSKSSSLLKKIGKEKDTYDEKTVGSYLGASGNINLNAGDNVAISGSDIIADKDVNIIGDSVSIIGAQENHSSSSKKSKSGLGAGSGDGFYSIWGKESKEKKTSDTNNVGSYIGAGGDVNITARNSDVNIIGSDIAADNDINLEAKRDINVTPGKESHSASETEKKSGFGVQVSHSNSGGSIGIGFGSSTDKKSEDHRINAKSGLSAGNDINMKAGNDVNLQAADVEAKRDVNINAGNDVNLLAANDISNYKEMHEKLFAGITVSVQSGTAQAISDIQTAAERINKGGSGMQGISNIVIGAVNGGSAIQEIKNNFKNGDPASISGSITVGFNHSKSTSESNVLKPVVTTIDAGRAVNIEAGHDINGVGVQINAGSNPLFNLIGDDKAGDITLKAGENINLGSAVGSQDSKSKSQAIGGGIGFDLNSMPTGNAYFDKGKTKTNGSYNVNSHITGTGDVSLEAGKDINLKGAVVTGESVKVNAGGDLNIESQLDKERVDIDHINISGGFSSGGANLSGTKQDGKGKSNTVNEQSGIHAGSGGFDIKVGDNTDLKGGLITSKADKDKNTLETGTLTWSDVETGSKWEVKTQGGGVNVGTGKPGDAGSGPLIKPTLKEGDKDTGSAKSGVSPGEITITKPDEQKQNIADLNRDTSNTNDTIKGLPDLQKKLNEQLKTQQEWAQAAENSAKLVKNIADKLHKQDGDIWGEGGAGRAALHAIAGGLLGGVNGLEGAIKAAVGAGVSTIIAPYIKDLVDQAVAQSGLKGEDAKRLSDTLTSSIVLGLLSGAGGSDTGSYAGNEIKYNLLTSEDRTKIFGELNKLLERVRDECDGDLNSCNPNTVESILKEAGDYTKEVAEKNNANINTWKNACSENYHSVICVDASAMVLNNLHADTRDYAQLAFIGNYVEQLAAMKATMEARKNGRITDGEIGSYYDSTYKKMLNSNGGEQPPYYFEYLLRKQDNNYGSSKNNNASDINDLLQRYVDAALKSVDAVQTAIDAAGTIQGGMKQPGKTNDGLKTNELVKPSKNPGTAQSRVNVAKKTLDNGKERGFDYAMNKHGNLSNDPDKSKYTISNKEVEKLLQSDKVIKSPVYNLKLRGVIDESRFVRQVDVGKIVGISRKTNKPTSIITVITNRKGNLINTFPGNL